MIKHIKDFLKSTASFENMRTTAILLFITYVMTGSVIKNNHIIWCYCNNFDYNLRTDAE